MTVDVRKNLRSAFEVRFFNRYHPIRALKRPGKIYGANGDIPRLLRYELESTDLNFSYLLDAQSLLLPALVSGECIVKMINSVPIEKDEIPVGWTVEKL